MSSEAQTQSDGEFNNHIISCREHDEGETDICWGRIAIGEKCINKAARVLNPSMPPTCEIHQYQGLNSGVCEALLPCGFRCTRRCAWQTHGFKLCPNHHQWNTTCYLLKIPIELRDRIYELVFTRITVKTKNGGSQNLVYIPRSYKTAILRANRQLHEEVAQHLVARNTIKIQLLDEGICMSTSGNLKPFGKIANINDPATFSGSHFKMMCRTEHGRLKFLRTRRESTISRQESDPTDNQFRNSQQIFTEHLKAQKDAVDSHNWIFPLTALQFNMLRRIRIEIYVFSPDSIRPVAINPESNAIRFVIHEKLKANMSEYCTQMRRLIEKLLLIPAPLSYLEVAIRFYDTCKDRGDAVSSALLLLEPFRRLRNVLAVKVLSVAPGPEECLWDEVESPILDHSIADKELINYLDCWTRELMGSDPLPVE